MKMKHWYIMGLLATMAMISANAQSTNWLDYEGCYSTVTFNGQPGSGLREDWGSAKPEKKYGWATMPGVDSISAFTFILFQYRQGNIIYGGYAWIFPEYGTTEVSADGKTRTWSFNGPMICTGLCHSPTPFTLNTKIEIKDLGSDMFQIHNFRQIPELPDQSMNADDIYVVKRERENCFMCKENPDGSTSCGPHS